jgi:hypothetical protein
MAIKTIEMIVENVLKQTGALAPQNGISHNRLKVAIRRTGSEHLHLPFAPWILGVAMRVDLRSTRLRLRKW